MEKISRRLFYISRNIDIYMSRAEWMNGICVICSGGRFISPSLPVDDDRYLNLSSQKRPTGRISGEIVRYDALAPRPEVLLPWCFVCVTENGQKQHTLEISNSRKISRLCFKK